MRQENTLEGLPNIGPVLAQKLRDAGITTPNDLKLLGSRESLRQIRHTVSEDACLSMLNALEGAVRGIRWHQLPADVKASLKADLQSGKLD